MKYFLFSFFFLFCYQIKAQKGSLLINNYSVSNEITTDFECNSMVQSTKGILYFANTNGILSYDGTQWQLKSIGLTPYSLAISSDGVIYVGGKENFGYLNFLDNGDFQFVSLASQYKNILSNADKSVGIISQITLTTDKVYFYSDKHLLSYQPSSKITESVLQSTAEDSFNGFFSHKESVFINVKNKGLHKIENKKLILIPSGDAFKEIAIISQFNFDKNMVCIAAANNILWLFDGQNFKPFNHYGQYYVNLHTLQKATRISDTQIAIGTLTGGTVLVDNNGALLQIIDYQNGLEDNEVLALGTDNQQGLWICHSAGISRVLVQMPVFNFSTYPGLTGKPTAIAVFSQTVFVGTNEGVFYLSSTNKENVSWKVAQETNKQLYNYNVQKQQQYLAKKKMQGKIKNMFNKSPVQNVNNSTKIITVVVESQVYSYNNGNYLVEKVPFNYQKIGGIDARVSQLVTLKNQVLARTNVGLYGIVLGSANLILPEEDLTFVTPSTTNDSTLYIASERGLFVLQQQAGVWKTLPALEGLKVNINSIVQQGNILWLGGKGEIFKVLLNDDGSLKSFVKYVWDKQSNADIIAREIKGNLLFFHDKGVLIHTKVIGDAFVPYKEYSQLYSHPDKIFFQQDNHAWLEGKNGWSNLNNPTYGSSFLKIFKNVHYIHQTDKGDIWLIADDKIIKIIRSSETNKTLAYKPFVKNIVTKTGKTASLKDTKLERYEEAQNFSFLLASPFFMGESKTEFQYSLEGIDDANWSSWKMQNSIEFPFLPSGSYELHLRTRNTLGYVSEVESFKFYIKPPFWETWWFYLIQVSVLFGLLGASIVYSRNSADSKVATIITLVAIITIFEFLVLLIEPYLDAFAGGIPLFKLIMNILLALSLNPIEKWINDFLKNSELIGRFSSKISNRVRWTERMEDLKKLKDNVNFRRNP
jgi:ligand-binding sensor domain-containing protein